MMIRIIAGYLGGRRIDAPDGSTTHPMSERIRNAVFNRLAEEIQGVAVLDAFAGSGSVGFEALSRGAESAVFIEKDRIAQKIIAKNIETLGVGYSAKLIKASVSQWLDTTDQQFTIIFADPPYHDVQPATLVRLFERVQPGGLFVLSYPSKQASIELPGAALVSDKQYGNATVYIYRRQ